MPVGRHTAVGLAPVISGYAFGDAAHSGPQLLSQVLKIDLLPFRNVWLELAGPLQLDWITTQLEWSFGVTVGLAPSLKATATDSFVPASDHEVERRDDAWSPAPLWYGRLKGHKPSWYVVGSTSPEQTPSSAIPGRFYGAHVVGAAVLWDRDAWGKRYATSYGGLFEVGFRDTSADFRYLTAVVGVDLRWYPVSLLGVSLVPVRLEAGIEASGTGADPALDVQSAGGRQYYFQVGSQLGLAFTAGLVDLVLQAPTLPWRGNVLSTTEILTFRVGIRL